MASWRRRRARDTRFGCSRALLDASIGVRRRNVQGGLVLPSNQLLEVVLAIRRELRGGVGIFLAVNSFVDILRRCWLFAIHGHLRGQRLPARCDSGTTRATK